MSDAKLRYGAVLLLLIQREAKWRRLTDWRRIEDLCDRFERLMASAREPLVWEGDYA